jgi:putative tricarboxylic transport membrane protein
LGGHLEVGMVSLSEVPELHGTNKGQLRAIAILSKRRFPSAARRSDGGGNRHPGHDDSGTRLRRTQGRFGRGSQKLEAAIADGLRNPEYIKSSPGDAPVLAFMPGAEWQKRLDDMSQTLRPFAEEMRGARAEVKRATLGALSCLWWGLKVSCAARRNSGPEGDLLSKAPILR